MMIRSDARRGAPGARVRNAVGLWAPLRACIVLALLLLALGPRAHAQVEANFADEDRDWGVPPTETVRPAKYHAPTPTTIPGARVVRTLELKAMLERDPKPFLVDVLSGPTHRTLPGALWLHNGGLGDYNAEEEQRFLSTIARLAGHDKARELVFFCSGAQCWLSYNAALRAAQAGYTNVYWYRGGIDAWREAGLPTMTANPFPW